jgi:phage internal scaffolding protein
MKKIISNRESGYRRSQLKFTQPSKTDQSSKEYCDINTIMAQYQRTGMLPHFKEKTPQYVDLSKIPNFIEAFDKVAEANQLFYELPSEIRNLMHHDPRNLEAFISDEKNHEVLEAFGMVEIVRQANKNKDLEEKKAEKLDKKD